MPSYADLEKSDRKQKSNFQSLRSFNKLMQYAHLIDNANGG
jgi:hypothetical protein